MFSLVVVLDFVVKALERGPEGDNAAQQQTKKAVVEGREAPRPSGTADAPPRVDGHRKDDGKEGGESDIGSGSGED